MFSHSSLASPSSVRRRASTWTLSRLFSGLPSFLSATYCCGVWHAPQCLARPSFSSVQAGHDHWPAAMPPSPPNEGPAAGEDEDEEEEEEEVG